MKYRHHRSWNVGNTKGITLIELIVVMAVVAILAAIAYPSYITQVRISKRAVAKHVLLDAANRQEQFFFSNRTYATALNQMPGYSSFTVYFDKEGSPTTVSADRVYSLYVAATCLAGDTPPCFLMLAVPQNDQTNDACGTYTLTSSNAKGAGASNCW